MEKYIKWSEKNFDMAFDKGTHIVRQETGNKGLGAVVAIMCGVAILVPSFFTVKQMMNGTASGNPVGAIVFVTLILGWPIYWGVKQFFQRRIIEIYGDQFEFTLISIIRRKKRKVPFNEYKKIYCGRTRSRSTSDFDGAIGYTGVYYVKLAHPDKRYTFDLYNAVPEQMEQERIDRYAKMFGLPVIDTSSNK